MNPDLLLLVHLPLRIQERNVGKRIPFRRPRREERFHHSEIFFSVGWILKIERVVEHGGPGHTVEVIRYEYRISFSRETLAEFAERRAQPERIGPNQRSGMRPGRWVKKGRVADAIRRFDLNIGLDDRQFRA